MTFFTDVRDRTGRPEESQIDLFLFVGGFFFPKAGFICPKMKQITYKIYNKRGELNRT